MLFCRPLSPRLTWLSGRHCVRQWPLRRPSFRNYSSHHGEKNDSHRSETRPRLGFRGYFRVYVAIILPINLGLLFIYEPLRDAGVFDTIVSSTIFRVVPPKQVRLPLQNAEDAPPLYQPITQPDEIRLLVLDPGAPGDELSCRLINVKKSWRTRYEALSYTWGDPTITRPLRCSGHTIDVTASLHDALTDLRDPTRKRLLWVDAVCINQSDNEEKSKQIMLMGSIYSRARRVLIYLGKGDPDVEGVAKDLRRLDWKFMPLHIQRYNSRLAILGPVGSFMIERLPRMKPIPEEEFSWDRVISLLGRPWFERTWVIQEAILGKRAKVICGGESIPWAMLERVAVAMDMYKGLVSAIPDYKKIEDAVSGISMIRLARRERQEYSRTPDVRLVDSLIRPLRKRFEHSHLLDLILESRKFACTNPRDKIYGMLGVTNQDTGSELLRPDYKLSKEDVYRNFVLWDILHNNSLRVLGCSWDKTGSERTCPSWVPDFTKLDQHHNLMRWENRAKYHASGDLPIVSRLSPDGSVLYLKGRIIDRLHDVGHRALRDRWKASRYNITNGVIEEAMVIAESARRRKASRVGKSSQSEDSLQNDAEDFLRALVCNRTDFGRKASPIFLNDVSRMVIELSDPRFNPSSARLSSTLSRPVEAFLRVAMSRRFDGTELGMIGYVPKTAIKGDFVVIFYGSDVPSIVRVGRNGKATLVGECYMHGIMDGEAMKLSYGAKEVEFALH